MMSRFVALLRGVNVSGKNQLAMSDLKDACAALGFTQVKTWLNSGNAVFSSEKDDPLGMAGALRAELSVRCALDVPVLILPQEQLRDTLAQAPAWWGTDDKSVYDNLILLLPPLDWPKLRESLGEPTAGLERAEPCGCTVFWSFDRQRYQKARWWSATANAPVRDFITIRTAGTMRKLVLL